MKVKPKGLEDVFSEIGGKLCDLVGWKRTRGQVYVLLYISDKPLSLEDIAKLINMSKSTVWAVIKKLQKLCAVNKVWIKETKKDGYTAEKDLDIILKNGIIPELSSKLLFAGSYLEQAEELLANSGQSTNPKELAKYHDFLNEFAKQKDRMDFFLKQLPLLINTNSSESKEK